MEHVFRPELKQLLGQLGVGPCGQAVSANELLQGASLNIVLAAAPGVLASSQRR